MRTPAHFTTRRFNIYILNCALRDREEYLRCISQEEQTKDYNETVAEIEAIKHRIKAEQQRKP